MPDYRYTTKVESADPRKPGIREQTGEVSAPDETEARRRVVKLLHHDGFYVLGAVGLEAKEHE